MKRITFDQSARLGIPVSIMNKLAVKIRKIETVRTDTYLAANQGTFHLDLPRDAVLDHLIFKASDASLFHGQLG
jgi:hypothetical protein